MYEPLKVFTYLGLTIAGAGLVLSLRFGYYVLRYEGFRHTNSLIAAAVLIILGFMVILMGLIADVNAANRKLLEDDGVMDDALHASFEAAIVAEIDDAVAFAEKSPFPRRSELGRHMFA